MQRNLIKNNIKSFLLGIVFFYNFKLVGSVNFGEIISLIYLLINFKKIEIPTELKMILKVSIFYTIIIIISDINNSNQVENSLKGAFTPILILITIIFLINFFNKRLDQFIIFFIGGVLSLIIKASFFSNLLYDPENIWKWGFGVNLLFIIYLIEIIKKKKFSLKLILLINITLILFSLYFVSRAIALIIFISTLFYIISRSNKMILNIFNSKLTFFFLPVVIFLIILALSKTTIITSKFVLFDKLNKKNELQQSEMSNLIFSARPEFFVYLNAIKDKPFLGHGSYPTDKNFYYRNLLNLKLYNYFITDDPKMLTYYDKEDQEIPTHSYLFESLINHGLLSLIYWLVLSYLITVTYIKYSKNMEFFYHLKVIVFFYSLFFSPLSYGGRLNIELLIALLIIYLNKNNNIQNVRYNS